MSLGSLVAKNVKILRLKFGLSQHELARKSALTVRYISRLENGSPNVTLDVLERLAKGLDCTVGQLVGERRDDVSVKQARQALEKAIKILQSQKNKLE